MSLNKNKGIKKIRKRLDLLDNKLLNIIKQRTKLVQLILSNKTSKKQIIDHARIKIILKNIKKKSLAKKNRYKTYKYYLVEYDKSLY